MDINKILVDVFFINNREGVFIKDIQDKKTIDIKDITIELESDNNINEDIKNLYNLTFENQPKKIVSQIAETDKLVIKETAYIICVNEEEEQRINESLNGKFINYKELDSLFLKYNKDYHFRNIFKQVVYCIEDHARLMLEDNLGN